VGEKKKKARGQHVNRLKRGKRKLPGGGFRRGQKLALRLRRKRANHHLDDCGLRCGTKEGDDGTSLIQEKQSKKKAVC